MKLAYVTTYDSTKLTGTDEWSGTGYYIAEALKSQSIELDYSGALKTPALLRAMRKIKRHYYQLRYQQRYEKNPDPLTLKSFAHQIKRKLDLEKSDVVFSATVEPIAYLECDRPIAFWTDATFAGLADFYSQYSNLHPNVIHDWHRMERMALEKCQLAIYSSDWAAKSAIEFYHANPNKIKVVPFGANINNEFGFDEIKDAIQARPKDVCKLLFIGVEWHRKGGNVAYEVAKQLNESGLKTELTIVGCQPLVNEALPEFVKSLGFISKSTLEGKERLNQLIIESHFLILPSQAECYGVVFAEANSLGVPCLSTKIGGIPSVIKDDENGRLFSSDRYVSDYCNYIENIFTDYARYQELAYSSFDAYKSRLNWHVAGEQVKNLLMEII